MANFSIFPQKLNSNSNFYQKNKINSIDFVQSNEWDKSHLLQSPPAARLPLDNFISDKSANDNDATDNSLIRNQSPDFLKLSDRHYETVLSQPKQNQGGQISLLVMTFEEQQKEEEMIIQQNENRRDENQSNLMR